MRNNNQPSPPASNRRTNLGVMVLLAAMLALGAIGAVLQAGDGNPLRYGMALGFSLASALGLTTFAVLVIGKKRRQPEAPA